MARNAEFDPAATSFVPATCEPLDVRLDLARRMPRPAAPFVIASLPVDLNGVSVAPRNGDARSIQIEMESHMSMHREMLLRKTDQLTLFEGDDDVVSSAPGPALDSSAWNLEADIDDELFHFLAE